MDRNCSLAALLQSVPRLGHLDEDFSVPALISEPTFKASDAECIYEAGRLC
jgi:hypothetical protein